MKLSHLLFIILIFVPFRSNAMFGDRDDRAWDGGHHDCGNGNREHFSKIEDKWHRDRGKPSALYAIGDHSDGLICRSSSANDDNMVWIVTHISSRGACTIEDKWHRDRGKPSALVACCDSDGSIRRSTSHNDNTLWNTGDNDNRLWYLTHVSHGAVKIENKWHRDRGKPSALYAIGDHSDGLIRLSSSENNDNITWYH